MSPHGHDHPDSDCSEECCEGHVSAGRRRAVEGAEEGREGGKLPDELEFRAHDAHAEEEQSETEHRFAPAAQVFPCDEHQQKPEDDRRHDDAGDVEGDDLRRDRGSDVGSEDDADRLHQVQESRVDEADHHDRRRAGGLDDRGDEGPRDDRHITVAGEEVENAAHPLSGGFMKSVAHELHAEDEDCEPTENVHEECVDVDAEFRHADSADCGIGLRGAHFNIEIVFTGLFPEFDVGARHPVCTGCYGFL